MKIEFIENIISIVLHGLYLHHSARFTEVKIDDIWLVTWNRQIWESKISLTYLANIFEWLSDMNVPYLISASKLSQKQDIILLFEANEVHAS